MDFNKSIIKESLKLKFTNIFEEIKISDLDHKDCIFTFSVSYADNLSFPSLFEFRQNELFEFDKEFFFNFMLDNIWFGLRFFNCNQNDLKYIVGLSKLTMLIYPVDKIDFNIHHDIERIRSERKDVEIILIWNAYKLENKRKIRYTSLFFLFRLI